VASYQVAFVIRWLKPWQSQPLSRAG